MGAIINYTPVKATLKRSQTHFSFTPKLVRANHKAEFTVKSYYDKFKFTAEEYRITMNPVLQIAQGKDIVVNVAPQSDGTLKFSAEIGDEQEYNVYIAKKDGENYNNIDCFNIYALNGDLFEMNPYKGDMHVHTYGSDGAEDPLYVAASYRRCGFDFMAVTDHHNYDPSVYMCDFYKNYKIDLALNHGEEIHAPENPVHIVNFGGSFSVNKIFREDKEKYYAEVAEIEKTVTDYPDMTDKREIYKYASSKWVFNKIREAGGISIFCHPYWRVGEGYHISDRLTEYILKKHDFDAYEVVGGYWPNENDSNALQIAKYNEMRAQGYAMPIVGVSDSHGCDNDALMNWYSTVVFAKSTSLKDIKEAILNKRSVAVETIKNEAPRVYGEFRYVAYAYFCMREIFPIHDVECSAEGALMYRVSTGDESAAKPLELLSGTCAKYISELKSK